MLCQACMSVCNRISVYIPTFNLRGCIIILTDDWLLGFLFLVPVVWVGAERPA